MLLLFFEPAMNFILLTEGLLIFLFFFFVFTISFQEKEYRAALISLSGGVVLSLPYILVSLLIFEYPAWLFYGLSGLLLLPVLLILVPVRVPVNYKPQMPGTRFDERDTMFSRKSLQERTGLFYEYYRNNPGKKEADDSFREKPGLLQEGSKYYDAVLFAAARSIFNKVDALHPRVEAPPDGKPSPVDDGDVTKMIKTMVKGWGAHSIGVCELKDYHVYTFGGRGNRYGQAFEAEHKFAVALTVEMDYDMMKMAPAAPTVLESANQYLNSGMMAVQLAEFIRKLGYQARAHIDGNYKIICPLVARDAGLGEIGRMGLLMTPRLGPRVRIAVVTTDIPLTAVQLSSDETVIDFCRHCKKCSLVCPAQSIPDGPAKEVSGALRWQINSESCYTFWCMAGTDCGRCIIVCPYSHPDNWFHRLIRFGIRNSTVFRRLALPLDDLFYGKKPGPRRV